MQKKMTERVNVGIMMSGQGPQRDVFSETYRFLKERKRREEALANDSTKKAYSPAQEQARRCGPGLSLRRRLAGVLASQNVVAHPYTRCLLCRHAAQTLNKNRFGWLLNFEAVLAGAFATIAHNVLNDSETFQKVRHHITSP